MVYMDGGEKGQKTHEGWHYEVLRFGVSSYTTGGKIIHLPMQEMKETWVPFLGREDPLEEGMAIHSTILAWKIPWTEEPGGQQSMGSQRFRPDWICMYTSKHLGLLKMVLAFCFYKCWVFGESVIILQHDWKGKGMIVLLVGHPRAVTSRWP